MIIFYFYSSEMTLKQEHKSLVEQEQKSLMTKPLVQQELKSLMTPPLVEQEPKTKMPETLQFWYLNLNFIFVI